MTAPEDMLQVEAVRVGTTEELLDPLDAHRLALHVAGSCRLERPVGGRWREFRPAPGSLVFAACGSDPRFRNTGSAEVLKVTVAGDTLSAAVAAEGGHAAGTDLTHLAAFEDALLRELIWALWRETKNGANAAYLRAAGDLLLRQLARVAGALAPAMTQAPLPAWRLRRADDYMRARVTDGFRLADLAAELRMSVSQLCSAYRQTTGLTVMQRFTHVRLDHARAQLRRGASVAAAAQAAGYATPAHFGHAFKRAFGVTPGRLRVEGDGLS